MHTGFLKVVKNKIYRKKQQQDVSVREQNTSVKSNRIH